VPAEGWAQVASAVRGALQAAQSGQSARSARAGGRSRWNTRTLSDGSCRTSCSCRLERFVFDDENRAFPLRWDAAGWWEALRPST